MSATNNELLELETALRQLFQALKRPHYWQLIQQQAGITIDRPAAVMLQVVSRQQQPLRVQELARQLDIEMPSVTRKTQSLEQAGHIRRLPDPHDKRAVNVQITPHGRQLAERISTAHRSTTSKILADWPASERKQFIQLLQKFSSGLNDVTAHYERIN